MPKRSFVLHDESVNTYGFRMLTSGADLSEFKRNPVMLVNHNDYYLPVGRWENIRVEGTQILADPVFNLKDKRELGGFFLSQMVEDDFIRMASIGAWPPEEVSDDPVLQAPGQTAPTVTRWKAREASIITIGANHNAIAFYDNDGKLVDMNDTSNVLKLFDNPKIQKQMNELNAILNLSDTATQAEQATALRSLISDRDRLKGENVTLKDKVTNLQKAENDKRKAEAVALVDAAVKDGRIDVKTLEGGKTTKDSWISLFDKDFDTAKISLASLPVRKSVKQQIEHGSDAGVELADLKEKSWDEIDRAGKLTLLYDKDYDLYAEKFRAKFNCEPKKAE